MSSSRLAWTRIKYPDLQFGVFINYLDFQLEESETDVRLNSFKFGIFMNMKLFIFQLEEGEIDVRLNSFKGCLSQDKTNQNTEKLPGEVNHDLGLG